MNFFQGQTLARLKKLQIGAGRKGNQPPFYLPGPHPQFSAILTVSIPSVVEQ
jgi:hypothetical protein